MGIIKLTDICRIDDHQKPGSIFFLKLLNKPYGIHILLQVDLQALLPEVRLQPADSD